MNLSDIAQRLSAGVYIREKSAELKEQFRQDIQQCFLDAGVIKPVAEKMMWLAWEDGHASLESLETGWGAYLSEVLQIAKQLMDIAETWIQGAKICDTLTVNPKTLLFENLTPESVCLLKSFSDEIFKNRKLDYQHPVIQIWYKQCSISEDRLAIMLDMLHQKILASIVEYFMAGHTL